MTEYRVVPDPPTEEMITAGEEALVLCRACTYDDRYIVRRVLQEMVTAAPPTEDAAALRAALNTFPDDSLLERYRKKLRDLADDMAQDAEHQVKESITENLAWWVEDLAKRAVDQLLRGNVEQMRRYLHCDGYTGRGDDSKALGFRERQPYEWHPIIHRQLHESDPIALRREIVEAHRDLITKQRVLDLEDQVKSLVDQVNKKDDRIEVLNRELREYHR